MDNVNEYYTCHELYQTFLRDESTPRTIIEIGIKSCVGEDVYLGSEFMEDYSLQIIGRRDDIYVATKSFLFSLGRRSPLSLSLDY